MLTTPAAYEKQPFVAVSPDPGICALGWDEIAAHLRSRISGGRAVVCVECYPGVLLRDVIEALVSSLHPRLVVESKNAFRSPAELDGMLQPWLTDDPVFGRMNGITLTEFFCPDALARERARLAECRDGLILVIGTGAAELAQRFDLLVYADMARWEIQRRQRLGLIGNLGAENAGDRAGTLYKRAFFADWRAADRTKCRLFERIDFLLDTNAPAAPKMVSGDDFRRALSIAVHRPFSVVPFFDPGPWGGSWMKEAFSLAGDVPNYAWGFNCVPEENSLLLGFGSRRIEIPALDVVLLHPLELLGEHVYRRFGAEFPIRFDFLDTIGGGNLSLQVHPMAQYIRQHFGMSYTQDESYYMLAADGGATVFLGLRDDVDPVAMERDLRCAAEGKMAFPAEKYVNGWPARKHDHFLIPAGTVHCSGAGSMVLEISATPYIFTFKLWDWNRMGLDGRPRPTHLEHGLANIQWDRRTQWVRRELINRVEPLACGEGWREERTGLHPSEFIETRRHWFRRRVEHNTRGTLNVLCLVEGREAVVESANHVFDPFVVRYAETFIVPAAVGNYSLRPVGDYECATLKAFVRPE